MIAVASCVALAASVADAGAHKKKRPPHREPHPHFFEDGPGQFFGGVPDFQVLAAPRESTKQSTAAPAPHPGAWGRTLLRDGEALWVIDVDAGELVRTSLTGAVVERLAVGRSPTQMVLDPRRKRLWISLRDDDRVVAVSIEGAPRVVAGFTVHDPYGLALAPDGARLLVTSAVEGKLHAFDLERMELAWQRRIGSEPRGVTIDPSGRRAMVGFLNLGAVAEIELPSGRAEAKIHYHALDPVPGASEGADTDASGGFGGLGNAMGGGFGGNPFANAAVLTAAGAAAGGSVGELAEPGRAFARNVFALAYLEPGTAVVPHQLSTPLASAAAAVDTGTYGGGASFSPPIRHRVSWLQEGASRTGHAIVGTHQPRALAYAAADDRLYVAGYGDDRVVVIEGARSATPTLAFTTQLGFHPDAGSKPCGIDGIEVLDSGLVVHCELDRSLRFVDGRAERTSRATESLTESRRSEIVQRGAELFRRGGDARISANGSLACASCHPEGLGDGLSWRIEGKTLQTPLLRGRLEGAHPFKWDGKDADLPTSLRNTVGRLGGAGLSAEDNEALQAYLGSLGRPRTPLSYDPDARLRGEALFASKELACTACHGGASLADGNQHAFDSDLESADTPSLIGLARSAPYFHDGSAPTLRALLLDNGHVHGMADTAQLSARQIDDLIAYLETL